MHIFRAEHPEIGEFAAETGSGKGVFIAGEEGHEREE